MKRNFGILIFLSCALSLFSTPHVYADMTLKTSTLLPADGTDIGLKVQVINGKSPIPKAKISATINPPDAVTVSKGFSDTDALGMSVIMLHAGTKPGPATVTIHTDIQHLTPHIPNPKDVTVQLTIPLVQRTHTPVPSPAKLAAIIVGSLGGTIVILIVIFFTGKYMSFLLLASRPTDEFLKLLLLDRQTDTYSLSRAHFLWWIFIITAANLFLCIGHFCLDHTLQFPILSGSADILFISLGTLVAAQIIASVKGTKGAGNVTSALSDLFVNGGVLSLDRVQLVLFSMIAGIVLFGGTITTTYATTKLPNVHQELITHLTQPSTWLSVPEVVGTHSPRPLDRVGLSWQNG